MNEARARLNLRAVVSMKSGLEGRNNLDSRKFSTALFNSVSMKSGLEGRNNG